MNTNTNIQRARRKKRTRGKLLGTTAVPRLSVFRSNNHIYAQLIDDVSGKSLFGISEKSLEKNTGGKRIETAKALGMELAKKAKEKKITTVMFDRGHYQYHGRVKAFAEGVREGGIVF